MKKKFDDVDAYVGALVACLSMLCYSITGSELMGAIAFILLGGIGALIVWHKQLHDRVVRVASKLERRR